MKKIFTFVFLITIGILCNTKALTINGINEENSNDISTISSDEENVDFFEINQIPLTSWDFSYMPSQIAKQFTITPSLKIENGALKATLHEFGYPLQTWYFESNITYLSTEKYFIEMDVKVNKNVNSISFMLQNTWDNLVRDGGGAADTIAIAIDHSKDRNTYTSTTVDKVGGKTGFPDITNGSLNYTHLNNGFDRIYFEFTPRKSFIGNAQVVLCYNEAKSQNMDDHIVLTDNLSFGIVEHPKYFTKYWDFNYDNINEDDSIWDMQPIWANNMQTSDKINGSKCLKIGVGSDTENDIIGGFEQRAENLSNQKLIKYADLTFFQYDIIVENCQMASIWSIDYETSILYSDSYWTYQGNVIGFNAIKLNKNVYRLSYYIDLRMHRDLQFNINASSSDGGNIYIDNLIVAHEDYSAYIEKNITYDYANPSDISIGFNSKGKNIVSVKLGDITLNAKEYDVTDKKIVIKGYVLNTNILGKTYILSIITEANSNPVMSTISQIDNRIEVVATYGKEMLDDIIYTGSNIYTKEIDFTLKGALITDDVKVTGNAILKDKSVGTTKVIVTNLILIGDDAKKYKLLNDKIELQINVKKAKVNVMANHISKEEGNADPKLTYEVKGLCVGDSLYGNLSREEGESVGKYSINLGTLNNDNYDIDFTGATFSIISKNNNSENDLNNKGCKGIVSTSNLIFLCSLLTILMLLKKIKVK